MNEVTLGDIFNTDEIEHLITIKDDINALKGYLSPERMDKINEVTGHENDAGFWAHLLQFLLPENDHEPDLGEDNTQKDLSAVFVDQENVPAKGGKSIPLDLPNLPRPHKMDPNTYGPA
jgi:hypothetical protein